uniref:Uncharacterized protein n=1 Tax=Felis catus TaxID=9685 RepID=A0ABI8A1C8_FELCA
RRRCNKEINNNCKYLCVQHGSIQIYNAANNNIRELINSNTIIVEDLKTPLTSLDRSSKQKIKKQTVALNDTLDQMDLTDIFRTFPPKNSRIHILFKYTWNVLQNRSHIRPQNMPQQS